MSFRLLDYDASNLFDKLCGKVTVPPEAELVAHRVKSTFVAATGTAFVFLLFGQHWVAAPIVLALCIMFKAVRLEVR